MKSYRETGLLFGGLNHGKQIVMMSILSCTCRNLKNNGSVVLFTCGDNTLYNLHVVNVESADGITAFISFFKHLCRINKWHLKFLQNFIYSLLYITIGIFYKPKFIFFLNFLKGALQKADKVLQ